MSASSPAALQPASWQQQQQQQAAVAVPGMQTAFMGPASAVPVKQQQHFQLAQQQQLQQPQYLPVPQQFQQYFQLPQQQQQSQQPQYLPLPQQFQSGSQVPTVRFMAPGQFVTPVSIPQSVATAANLCGQLRFLAPLLSP